MSDAAIAAWRRQLGDRESPNRPRYVEFGHHERLPFTNGEFLGRGGMSGDIYSTSIDGEVVAWKRRSIPALDNAHFREVDILIRLSEKRHKHIVHLIGAYTQRRRRDYDLGLLIWPVAQCDLKVFLNDLDTLTQWIRSLKSEVEQPAQQRSLASISIANISTVLPVNDVSNPVVDSVDGCENLLRHAQRRLQTIFGCTANAVAWLHHNRIRHKDLKPAQILVSHTGLWLTDFGTSNDMSDVTVSATNDGYAITPKYHAPERTNMLPCDWPEDMFTLGCIYLEMAYRLLDPSSPRSIGPWEGQQNGWSFQASLVSLDLWLDPLLLGGLASSHIANIVRQMMQQEPSDRLSVGQLIQILGHTDELVTATDDADFRRMFFGTCCQQRDSAIRLDVVRSEAMIDPAQVHQRGRPVPADETDSDRDSHGYTSTQKTPSTKSSKSALDALFRGSSGVVPLTTDDHTVVPLAKNYKPISFSASELPLHPESARRSKAVNLSDTHELDKPTSKDVWPWTSALPRKGHYKAPTVDNERDSTNRQVQLGGEPLRTQSPQESSFLNSTKEINRTQLTEETLEELREAWLKRFGGSVIELQRTDPEPCQQRRWLGRGGLATVYESSLSGLPVVLKMILRRRARPSTSSAEVLHFLTRTAHTHVVSLIGYYTFIEKRRGLYSFGYVLWPVGVCDLARLLEIIDVFAKYLGSDRSISIEEMDYERDDLEIMQYLLYGGAYSEGGLTYDIRKMYVEAMSRLKQTIGCIASAVTWLHHQSLQHGAIVPSNIILSQSGVWLSSVDRIRRIKDDTEDYTGYVPKYKPPEVVYSERAGLPGDVFSLGCTFLEIAYRLAQYWNPGLRSFRKEDPGSSWSVPANLTHIRSWLQPLKESMNHPDPFLALLVEDMLEREPEERPSMSEVLARLSTYHRDTQGPGGRVFCSICKPSRELDLGDERDEPPTVEPDDTDES